MRIGLIDCDKHNSKNPFPNLALMKLSAWHKKQGDTVEWYANFNGHYDRVYVSKVFSFSDDYLYPIDATEIIKVAVDMLFQFRMAEKFTTKN